MAHGSIPLIDLEVLPRFLRGPAADSWKKRSPLCAWRILAQRPRGQELAQFLRGDVKWRRSSSPPALPSCSSPASRLPRFQLPTATAPVFDGKLCLGQHVEPPRQLPGHCVSSVSTCCVWSALLSRQDARVPSFNVDTSEGDARKLPCRRCRSRSTRAEKYGVVASCVSRSRPVPSNASRPTPGRDGPLVVRQGDDVGIVRC